MSNHISEEAKHLKKYPFEKQLESKDCGAACLSMIIRYYQGYYPIEDLREMTKTNRDGTTAFHLIETLKEIGFEANGVECSLENFPLNNILFPCIANVIIDESYKHFIVIYHINYKKKYLIIGDPSDKVKKIKFTEFINIYNNVLILMKPIKTISIVGHKNYKYLVDIVLKNKKFIRRLIELSLLLTILATTSSFFIGYMIKYTSYESLILIFIIFFAINMGKIVVDYIRNRLLIYINQRISYDLTMDVFQKIVMLPYRYYRNRTTGDILSRVNDLSLVKDIISKVALSLFIDLPITFISLIILVIINYKLSLVAIIMFSLYVIIMLFFRKSLNSNIKSVHQKQGETSSFMVEHISGFETVKGLHLENSVVNKFRNKYYNLSTNILKYQKNYFLQHTLKQCINDIGLMMVILVGCLLMRKGSLELGSLLIFNVLLNYFLDPLRSIVELDSEIKEAKSSLKRVMEIMYKSNSKNGVIKDNLKGNINYVDLNYSFNDRDLVLKHVNLVIPYGNKIMVIGKSGGGKSTLFKILMKYYPVRTKNVFINDIDINDLSDNSIDNIVYINQNENLFNDTLYNNINISGSSSQKFMEVAKMCYVDSIARSDLGYNMIIEENGFNISGGERQRIALARTLLRPFNILIIDEGLSQLDINLERKILKNLFKRYCDKTIIVISHRLDNIDLFDQLVEINNGTIIRNEEKNRN